MARKGKNIFKRKDRHREGRYIKDRRNGKPSMDMSLENRTWKLRQKKLRQCNYYLA